MEFKIQLLIGENSDLKKKEKTIEGIGNCK